MSNRFVLPLETPVDATGMPYPGGKLFFYQNLTTTKLATYSDPGLTIANSNPVVLDSAGRFPNAIFLQNTPYTVVLAPSTDSDPPTSPIWTQDNVYTSDYSTTAKLRSGSGNPNGSVAGTAGSATIGADEYWDYTNFILYVCSTTGTSSTAVWTAINASTAAAVVPPPQGRLTLTSGVPVLSSDVTAATAVIYTPYTGNLCPIWNGATFIPTAFTEQTLTLSSSHAANNIYDVFMFSNSGVPTVVTGPSWSAGTSGSITAPCARGTGTGGTALSNVNGVLTNTVQIAARNGATTYTINANLATYLGTIFIDGTNGQVSCLLSYGQSRKWGVWNAYNRVPIYMIVGDGTASWNGNSGAGIRASNGNTANSATIFSGLAEESYDIRFTQTLNPQPTSVFTKNGIGFNAVNAFSGKVGVVRSATNESYADGKAEYEAPPSLGINVVTCLEFTGTTQTNQFIGTQASMEMSIRWRG